MELSDLRNKIDKIDKELINLFSERFILAKKIGEYKKKYALPIIDEKRETEKKRILINEGALKHLSEEFVNTIWDILLKESYKIERNI